MTQIPYYSLPVMRARNALAADLGEARLRKPVVVPLLEQALGVVIDQNSNTVTFKSLNHLTLFLLKYA